MLYNKSVILKHCLIIALLSSDQCLLTLILNFFIIKIVNNYRLLYETED